ncbi:MAG: pgl [Caulobacter sp.]|nr:pgl [Caulobacter sp.]
MTAPIIERHIDARSAAHAAGAAIAAALADGIAQRGHAGFAGAGGRTPGETYAWLSTADLAWDKVTVTLTDERWVDPDSPQSNEALLRDTLLQDRGAAARLLPLWSAAPSPEAAADAAGPVLAEQLPLDAVLLGMGEDGHFASLFPGSPVLAEGLDPDGQRLVVAAPVGEPMPPQPRISLTLAALLQTRLLILLVTGEAKLKALEAPDGLPISALLTQTRTPVRILWAP